MNPSVSLHAVLVLLTGCCINLTTSVRNETGRTVRLTSLRGPQPPETVEIPAKSTVRCRGVMQAYPGSPVENWIVSDGQSRCTYLDVTPIASMPRPFISRSRLTRQFPCMRLTQHVRLAPDMTIHAVRVIGYTGSEPAQFPLHPARIETIGDQAPAPVHQ